MVSVDYKHNHFHQYSKNIPGCTLVSRLHVNETTIAMGQDMLKSKLQGVVNLLKEKQQQAPDLALESRMHVNETAIGMGQDMLKSKLLGIVNLLKEKQQQAPDLFVDTSTHPPKSFVVVDVAQGKMALKEKLLKLANTIKAKQSTSTVAPSGSPETPWYLTPLDIKQSIQKKTTSEKPVASGVIEIDNVNLLKDLSPLKISGTPRQEQPATVANQSKPYLSSGKGKLLPSRPSMSPPRLSKANHKITKNTRYQHYQLNVNLLVTKSPKPYQQRFQGRDVVTSPSPSGRIAPCPPRGLQLPSIHRKPVAPPTKSAFAPSFERKAKHRKFVPATGLPPLPLRRQLM